MGRAENAVEGYLVRECERRGWICWKVESPSRRGFPDRYIAAGGIHVLAETKAPDGRPSKIQLAQHRKLRAQGIRVEIPFTRDDVDTLISDIEQELDAKGDSHHA